RTASRASASWRAAHGASAPRCAAAVCPSARRPTRIGDGAARADAADRGGSRSATVASQRTGRPRWRESCPTQPAAKSRPDPAGRGGAGVAQPSHHQNRAQPGPGGASASAPPGRGSRNAAPQQNVAPQQGVMQQNQASRAVPPSAPRARAASDPRAFSGGVLRNQAFANWATARDPSVRTVASSTFQGRFFNPQWRRHFTHPVVIGWIGPLFWPYAYYDFVDYTFYPYAYDTFWPYAYDDVYEGLFGAYALGYGDTYAAV